MKDLVKAKNGRLGGIASGIARRKLIEDISKTETMEEALRVYLSNPKVMRKVCRNFLDSKLSAKSMELIITVLNNG